MRLFTLPILGMAISCQTLHEIAQAEPIVSGDLAVAAAIGDAMLTRLAELDRGGRIVFRWQHTRGDVTKTVEGEYLWGRDRDAFRGTIREAKVAPEGATPVATVNPFQTGALTWFRTRSDEFLYNSEVGVVYGRTPLPDGPLLDAPLHPWRDAFYSGTHRVDPLSGCCAPGSALAWYRVAVNKDGQVDIRFATAEEPFPSHLQADLRAGGFVSAYSTEPPSPYEWRRGRFVWRQNAAGEWYPARIEHAEFPHGDFDTPIQTTVTEILEYSSDTNHPADRFRFADLKLPIGTSVTVARETGVQSYVVGGATGRQLRFQTQLEEAAEKLRAHGFAAREREESP